MAKQPTPQKPEKIEPVDAGVEQTTPAPSEDLPMYPGSFEFCERGKVYRLLSGGTIVHN